MLEANGRINLAVIGPFAARIECQSESRSGANRDEKETSSMADVLNLALPYFSLIFIGYACGKARELR
jgi:hypothetical protein